MASSLQDFELLKSSLSDEITKAISILKNYEKLSHNGQINESGITQNKAVSYTEILIDQIQNLKDGIFRILVLGEFSTGKSTFLNALLKERILPVAVRPTTATINKIRYSPEKKVVLNFLGERDENGIEISEGIKKEIKVEELIDYTTALSEQADNTSRKIKIVEIFYPTEYCKNSVEILDTPGLASVNEHHDKITLNYLPKGNACIMLLNPGQPLSKSERHYLRIVKNYISKVFFVLNKINLLDESDKEEAIEYIADQLKKELGITQNPELYPLNAKLACSGDWESSNFGTLVNSLETFLTSAEKGREMITIPAFSTLNALLATKQNCKLMIEGLKFSPEDFENKIKENLPKLERIKRRQNDLIQFIGDREQNLLHRVEVDLDNNTKEFISGLSYFILNYASDLENFKSDFEEYFKENIVELNTTLEGKIQEELNFIIVEVTSRFKDFAEELNDYRSNIGKIAKVNNEYSIKPYGNDTIMDFAISFGGAFGIGWLSALLLAGPLGWILAFLGGSVFSVIYQKFKQKKILTELNEKIILEVKVQFNKILPEAKKMIKENIYLIKNHAGDHMNTMIGSVENVIKEIKKDMLLEETKLNRRRLEFQEIVTEIEKTESRISKQIAVLKN